MLNERLRTKVLPIIGLVAIQGTAVAKNTFVPFSVNSDNVDQGLWFGDVDNPANPPIQLTNQLLDGNHASNIAVLNTWTYDATRKLATNVEPQIVVYGTRGHLYKADARKLAPIVPFGNTSYQELCSLAALDPAPFAAAKAFVQAVVEPIGSGSTCASGVGTQTWLFSINADGTTAPTLEPTNWTVLGAFTDPTTEAFVKWLVWTGNSVDVYKNNFTTHLTVLVGPPTGPAPGVISRVDGTALVVSGMNVGAVHTNNFYAVTATGSAFLATQSYATTSPCVGTSDAGGVINDPASGLVFFTAPTSSGFAAYSVPIAGGPIATVYEDDSGAECGLIIGDGTSAGRVPVTVNLLTTGFSQVVSLDENGPASQAPLVVAGDGVSLNASVRYTINGHLWIDEATFGPTVFTTLVADGDGTVVASYPSSRIGTDTWDGFFPSGLSPGVDRGSVLLYSPNPGVCSGGAYTAIDGVTLAATALVGLPDDTCRQPIAFAWAPVAVGGVTVPDGNIPILVDTAGGRVYQLLGPDVTGGFTNEEGLGGYPFF